MPIETYDEAIRRLSLMTLPPTLYVHLANDAIQRFLSGLGLRQRPVHWIGDAADLPVSPVDVAWEDYAVLDAAFRRLPWTWGDYDDRITVWGAVWLNHHYDRVPSMEARLPAIEAARSWGHASGFPSPLFYAVRSPPSAGNARYTASFERCEWLAMVGIVDMKHREGRLEPELGPPAPSPGGFDPMVDAFIAGAGHMLLAHDTVLAAACAHRPLPRAD